MYIISSFLPRFNFNSSPTRCGRKCWTWESNNFNFI